MSRCDSAAIVANTSELLPEPETPVNTVSRRLGISTLMSLRLFTRAPCTRIMSWESAVWSSGASVSVLVAMAATLSPIAARVLLRSCSGIRNGDDLLDPGAGAVADDAERDPARDGAAGVAGGEAA